MRLTQYDRQAFVAAAMEDVPQVNYDKQAEKLVKEYLKTTLPVDLQNAMVKYPDWFPARSVQMPGELQNFATPMCRDNCSSSFLRKHPKLLVQVEALSEMKHQQTQKRCQLEMQLKGAISHCPTLKAALEILPEFAKYLPEDRDGDKKCRQTPVIANLITDMMNAGWPKGKEATPVNGK